MERRIGVVESMRVPAPPWKLGLALALLVVFDLVHLLFSVTHHLPFCPGPADHGFLGCSSFVSVSLVFGLVQLCVVAASFAWMAVARVRVLAGVLVSAVPVAVLVRVAYGFSLEGLDMNGVEDAEHLVGDASEVAVVDALLAALLVVVCVLGTLALRRRAARADAAPGRYGAAAPGCPAARVARASSGRCR